jgi:alkaline phosphatase
MVEASRIDHAAHANDPVGHLHDTLQYNEVVDYVRRWINRHPDTQMLSAADHECGGLTLVQEGYNPLILKAANSTVEALASVFSKYTGNDAAGFLRTDIYPRYGISNPTAAEIAQLVPLKNSGSFTNALGRQLSSRAGINWATAQHSAVDVSLFGYAAGDDNKLLRGEMGGNWDNTQLPGYIEKVLGVRVRDATAALRKNGTSWVGKRDLEMEKRSEHSHSHN